MVVGEEIMKNEMTKEEYDRLEDVSFPLSLNSEININELNMGCDLCDGNMHHLRIEVSCSIAGCYELNVGGYCSECGVYQTGRLRYYTKDRRIMEFTEEGLCERRLIPDTWIDSLKLWFRKIFKISRE